MPATQEIRQPYRQQARQWSRMAWALAILFASMPAASRIFLGVWGFDGAAEIACLCLILGTYFHIVGRRRGPPIPDPATMLDQAIQLASSGQIDPAIALLTETIRLSPQLWQAFQYRGELYLRQQSFDAALQDLNEAIRLAPEEPHLYILRGQAQNPQGEGQL
jgi:tetratricopeptide (TPR) repeat protein